MEDSEIKRIVLCRLGGIGDVIHTLPLVKFLRKKYSQASIEYITSENVAELLISCCPYIDNVWTLNKEIKNHLFKNLLVNRGKIDFFFNLHNTLTFYFYNLFYFKARKFFQYKKDIKEHVVINFVRTYNKNVSVSDLDSKVLFVDRCEEILGEYGLHEDKYVCFVPGVGRFRSHRAWMLENWIKLTKSFLNQEQNIKVVYLGGDDEKKIAEYLPCVNNKTINLIGKLNLPETTKIISKSACLVSCDTGLLHIANGFSKKVIGLYGPTLSSRSKPLISDSFVLNAQNCECNRGDTKACKKTNDLSGYCMNSLKVESVLSKIVDILRSQDLGLTLLP